MLLVDEDEKVVPMKFQLTKWSLLQFAKKVNYLE